MLSGFVCLINGWVKILNFYRLFGKILCHPNVYVLFKYIEIKLLLNLFNSSDLCWIQILTMLKDES